MSSLLFFFFSSINTSCKVSCSGSGKVDRIFPVFSSAFQMGTCQQVCTDRTSCQGLFPGWSWLGAPWQWWKQLILGLSLRVNSGSGHAQRSSSGCTASWRGYSPLLPLAIFNLAYLSRNGDGAVMWGSRPTLGRNRDRNVISTGEQDESGDRSLYPHGCSWKGSASRQ